MTAARPPPVPSDQSGGGSLRPQLGDRIEGAAARQPVRVAGYNPALLLVRVARHSAQDRVPGVAAEMAFFALLSIVPLLVALGAALGSMERALGGGVAERFERAAVRGLSVVFDPELVDGVMGPLLEGLLTQQRAGVAATAAVVSLWLASRVVTAAMRGLDQAWETRVERSPLTERLLGVAFALAGALAFPVTLAVLLLGPLLGGGQALAARLGISEAFAVLWAVGRWPLLVLLVGTILTWLYRIGPSTTVRLRHALPGAVAAMLLWIAATLAFRFYLEAGGPRVPTLGDEEDAVRLMAQVLGAVVATVLWIYVSGIVTLLGGELNAALARHREPVTEQSDS